MTGDLAGGLTGDLTGRRALVTGGASGIGRAVALGLAARGADVALTHRTHDGGPVAAEITSFGRRGAAFALDASDPVQVDDVVTQAGDALGGPVDILINNIGGLVGRRGLTEMTDEHWQAVLDVNVTSTFRVTRAVLAGMPDGGRIVSIGSLAAANGGGPGAVAYATAKAALEGFTRGLAKELGSRGITVNCVAPGFIGGTPFHAAFTPEPAQRAAIAGTLVGRAGEPGDVAAAVAYLVSPHAAFVTGAVLDVNGGAAFR